MSIVRWKLLTIICGFLAPLVLIAGTVWTACVYQGHANEAYSLRDHFISELGEVGVSRQATLFNATLIVNGIIVSGFMLGLGMHLASKGAYVAAAFGIGSGLACSVVGMIPMNSLLPHIAISFFFFFCGMVSVAAFVEAIWLDRCQRISKWLVLPGILATSSFLALAAAPPLSGLTHFESLDPHRVPRWELGVIPLIEWIVFVMIIVWLLCVAITLSVNFKLPTKFPVSESASPD
jgi:hypothetical protein